MKLKTGNVAPLFNMPDMNGNDVSLETWRGQPVFLSFFKWATCPLCNLRIREIMHHFVEFEARNMQIIGVFHSPAAKLREHMTEQSLPFPLIADPEMQLYKQYGVTQSLWGVMRGSLRVNDFAKIISHGLLEAKMPDVSMNVIPANFLIDGQGIIQTAYYGRDIGDHLALEEILDFAEQIAVN